MLGEISQALVTLVTGAHLFYLLLGVCLGFAVGILPGLGGIVGFSVMLPFLYGMDPTSALAMLIGLVAVVPTSDTLTSILLGIPGSSSSQATVVDGFPLAKRGEGARALSAAYFASLAGGLFGALALTIFVIAARPLILLMGSAELFMLGMFGVAMVGLLSGRDMLKGAAACGLGLVLGSLGSAPATGEARLTLGSFYLYDGLRLVIVGLAVFAIPEIAELLAKRRAIAERPLLGRGWIKGLADAWRARWLVLRCSTIGCLIGALPGLGGSVVDWIAYGHVVQSSKDRERFGKGDIRGVIAPESANNAKEGGGLIPTLLFGVPGSGSMAVFLGGLTLLGIEPGPALAGGELHFTYAIIWSLALANVLGAGMCIVLSPQIARLTAIPYGILAPFMMMIICFAAFQANKQLQDLAALLALGAFAILMKRYRWPRPALLIGFVLSDTLETYLYQAVQFYGWAFAARPGVIIIFLLAAASALSAARYHARLRPPKSGPPLLRGERGDLWMAGGLGLFFAAAAADALRHSFLGGIFPGVLAAASLALCALIFIRTRRGLANAPPQEPPEAALGAMLLNFGWLVLLALLAALFGFVIALIAVFIAVMRRRSAASWRLTIGLTAAGVGGLLLLAHFARMDFPWGVLQYYVDLPWPLG